MIHVEGKLGDRFVRESTKTRAWMRAAQMVKDAEKRGSWETPKPDPETELAEESVPAFAGKAIAEAVKEFLADAEDPRGRNLAPLTMVKYRTILGRLVEFSERRGLVTLPQIDFGALTAFKREWATGALATIQNIARLRTFLQWCEYHEWNKHNPARKLDKPKGARVERLPYTKEEMQAILEAARTMKLDPQQPVSNFILETFILLMRYTGIAISDAAMLETSEIRGDEIRLYRNKTSRNAKRTLVVVPMPDFLTKRLKSLPLQNGRYYFAYGTATITNQAKTWQHRMSRVFKAAGITNNPGSHRFRHTFATDLLERGYSIELVSKWLGHENIKVTQEHYSHWIESRIKAASDALRKLYTNEHGPDA